MNYRNVEIGKFEEEDGTISYNCDIVVYYDNEEKEEMITTTTIGNTLEEAKEIIDQMLSTEEGKFQLDVKSFYDKKDQPYIGNRLDYLKKKF